jgi:hypothetical protein
MQVMLKGLQVGSVGISRAGFLASTSKHLKASIYRIANAGVERGYWNARNSLTGVMGRWRPCGVPEIVSFCDIIIWRLGLTGCWTAGAGKTILA